MTGVMAAPGDPNSAERGIIRTIDLLTPENMEGFRIDAENQWTPKRAQVKNGGLWVETATADGRELLAAKRGNVVETITLLLRASTMLLLNKRMAELERFAQDAQDFFETTWQIEPCYIKYWAQGAPGAQYALVYIVNSDIQTLDYGDINQLPIARVVLTIEREYAWRGLWPGANPIEWTFQAQNKSRGSTTPGEGYTYANMSLYQNTDHFAYAVIQNRCEFVTPDYQLFHSKNFIDLPAIPGDASPLICLNVKATSDNFGLLHVASSSQPNAIVSSTPDSIGDYGENYPAFAILNVGDADSVLVTKATDTCGVISNNSNTVQHIGTYTEPAGGAADTFATIISWTATTVQRPFKSLNLFRGTWAAFLRCKQTNGSEGDVRVRLIIQDGEAAQISLPETQIPFLTPAASCSNEWELTYLGQFRLPFSKNAFSAVNGLGLAGAGTTSGFFIQTRNLIAATRTLEFLDLVLMPIDSGHAVFTRDINNAISFSNSVVTFDNTGYTGHGLVGDTLHTNQDSLASEVENNSQELRGIIPTLFPGNNNRIYFIASSVNSGGAFIGAKAGIEMTVRLNIIPRWLGIRDV